MEYAEIIQQIMVERNLNQQKFTDILGVNQTTINQWLLGQKSRITKAYWLFTKNFDISQTFYLE